jgi:hypothetical protein
MRLVILAGIDEGCIQGRVENGQVSVASIV